MILRKQTKLFNSLLYIKKIELFIVVNDCDCWWQTCERFVTNLNQSTQWSVIDNRGGNIENDVDYENVSIELSFFLMH